METKKSKSRNDPLPEDLLLHEILPRLPTKSVIRFKSVSKTWLSLISQHSSLIAAKHITGGKPDSIIHGLYRTGKRRFHHIMFFLGHNESNLVEIDTSYVYSKNPSRVVLLGSCNGLVCLQLVYSLKTHDLVLWNPATKEVNYLPTREDDSDEVWITKYAFGFDAHSGVEKVIRLQKFFGIGGSVKGQIFSKKSGRWRNLKSSTAISGIVGFNFQEDKGLTVDGVIYWKLGRFDVLSFDLTKEEFRRFGGPHDPSSYPWHVVLINWKGFLGAVFVIPGSTEIELWLHNKDSNSDSRWKKISTIQPSFGSITLAARLFRGQIIHCKDHSDLTKDIYFDLVTKEKRELEQGILEKVFWHEISDHFYTLVSPN